MAKEPKGRPFLEILSSALQEDYRFPILEIFVFLYAISTFALAAASFLGFLPSGSTPASAINLVGIVSGTPLFIFIILVLKNIAFGLGGDLERGTLQTFLSYPITRRGIITAKMLSALGLSLGIFLVLQFFGLSILAPSIFSSQIQVVILAYLSAICYPLILTGIILMITLLIRRGAIALVIGIVLYFAAQIVPAILFFVAFATRNILPLQILSVFNPSFALSAHYNNFFGGTPIGASVWTPSLQDVYTFIFAGYVLMAAFFTVAYYIFDRRLGL